MERLELERRLLKLARQMDVERGHLTRSRRTWEALLEEYGMAAAESEAVRLISLELRASPHRNVTIAFPQGVIDEVLERLDAQLHAG